MSLLPRPERAIPEDRGGPGTSPSALRRLLGALLLAGAMSMLDQSIVATAGPRLVSDLGSLNHYSWTFTAYMLTFAVVMPVYGKLGDLFGRRRLHLLAVITFLAGSAACGAATSMEQLVVFRAVQGLGGGALQVSAFAVLADVLSPQRRAKYQSSFAGVMIVANLAGPVVGGALTDTLGWRWIFYVNLPLGLLALAGLWRYLPRTGRRDSAPRIDVRGAVLLSASVVCLVLTADLAGRRGWGAPEVVALAAAAVLCGTAWLWSARSAQNPVVPLGLFRVRGFTVSVTVAFVVSFAFFGCVNFVPVYFQVVNGTDATRTGLLFLPAMIGMALATLFAGQVIGRTGRYKWFPVASTALAGVAAVGMSLVAQRQGGALLAAGFLCVMGIGVGLSSQVTTLVAQSSAPRRDVGVSTSTVGLARNLGVAFGAAVFGALLNARIAAEAADRLSPERAEHVVDGALRLGHLDDLDQQVLDGIGAVYGQALSVVFLCTVPLLAVGLALSLLLKDERLEQRRGGPPGERPQPAGAKAERDQGETGVEGPSSGT